LTEIVNIGYFASMSKLDLMNLKDTRTDNSLVFGWRGNF